jgi:hypothetical protein
MLQILAAAEKIEELIRDRIEGHRIDRKIAAASGFLRSDIRIERCEKVAMGSADLAIAAREAEIVNGSSGDGELHNAEASSYEIHAAVMRK